MSADLGPRPITPQNAQVRPGFTVALTQVKALPFDELMALDKESEAQGFDFVHRLLIEWQLGTNRFDQPGEVFFIARVEGRIVGVGGLNRDPYADETSTGRIRHVYVASAYRRRGIGKLLVTRLINHSRLNFSRLHLRTDTQIGASFYESIGFGPVPALSKAARYTHLCVFKKPQVRQVIAPHSVA